MSIIPRDLIASNFIKMGACDKCNLTHCTLYDCGGRPLKTRCETCKLEHNLNHTCEFTKFLQFQGYDYYKFVYKEDVTIFSYLGDKKNISADEIVALRDQQISKCNRSGACNMCYRVSCTMMNCFRCKLCGDWQNTEAQERCSELFDRFSEERNADPLQFECRGRNGRIHQPVATIDLTDEPAVIPGPSFMLPPQGRTVQGSASLPPPSFGILGNNILLKL